MNCRLLPFLIVVCFRTAAAGSDVSIIPRPVECDVRSGSFIIDRQTVVVVPEPFTPVAELFCSRLRTVTGLPLTVSPFPVKGHSIVCSADTGNWSPGPEGYTLVSDRNGVTVSAASPAGLFYGFQTLIQLLPPAVERHDLAAGTVWSVQAVRIKDRPRFPWRGMHLDVSRHFFPTEFIRKYIDLLAAYKLNTFHWHLTDDQGWRIEIKSYPRLTEVGSKRRETTGDCTPYGGFYTQDEIRSVVAYAKERFITIVPEIEMPAHAMAALASYPEYSCSGGPIPVGTEWGGYKDVYCAGKDATFEFLDKILDEVAGLFPGPYIHIGGDECPKLRWQNCLRCWTRMQKEGLKTPEELQSYFIRRIERILNAKGKRLIGWDEILEGGLAPNATVMSWRGIDGGIAAAKAGHDVVMSPASNCYFDNDQGVAGEPEASGAYLPLDSVYAYEPVPSELSTDEASHVIGAQGNVWTERISTTDQAEYMVLPRLCAMSELTWTPRSGMNFSDFYGRVARHYPRFSAAGLNFRVPTPVGFGGRSVIFSDTDVRLVPPVPGAKIRWTSDGHDPTPASDLYSAPIRVRGDMTIKALVILPDGKQSIIVPGTYFRADKSANGIMYRMFSGRWDSLPDFSSLTPAASGKIYDIGLDGFAHPRNNYAVEMTGRLTVPAEGDYRFTLSSDDGSMLLIGGTVVVNNNKIHGGTGIAGTIRLTAGEHAIEVRYFQRGGGSRLECSIAGPGIDQQILAPSMLMPPLR